jgi:hypothetical protein
MASSSSPKSLSQCRPRSTSTPRHSPPLPSRWELSEAVGHRCLSHCRVTSFGMKDARGARDIDGVIQTLCWQNKLNNPIDQLQYVGQIC